MSPACRPPGAYLRCKRFCAEGGRAHGRPRQGGRRDHPRQDQRADVLGDWQSFNDIYGTTNNPWDLARSPGGSSGGSSAALAAGFAPLSLGSDIGGSLRVPAHYCGIYAHKPTLNLMPAARPPGCPALFSAPAISRVVGPMARSAADLEFLLDLTSGPDETRAGIAYRLALPKAAPHRAEGFPRAGGRRASAASDRRRRALRA